MIPQREFYFVRHGETDHNLLQGKDKGDHTSEIPLNQTGKQQAEAIEPLIALLPVQSICSSPMRRAQETKAIISQRLQAPHFESDHLSECTALIWDEMRQLGMYSPLPTEGPALSFVQRVEKGLSHALSLPGPCLIVAHGGVHWATCWLLGLHDHEWRLDNCGVVHFSYGPDQKWRAKRLTPSSP